MKLKRYLSAFTITFIVLLLTGCFDIKQTLMPTVNDSGNELRSERIFERVEAYSDRMQIPEEAYNNFLTVYEGQKQYYELTPVICVDDFIDLPEGYNAFMCKSKVEDEDGNEYGNWVWFSCNVETDRIGMLDYIDLNKSIISNTVVTEAPINLDKGIWTFPDDYTLTPEIINAFDSNMKKQSPFIYTPIMYLGEADTDSKDYHAILTLQDAGIDDKYYWSIVFLGEDESGNYSFINSALLW